LTEATIIAPSKAAMDAFALFLDYFAFAGLAFADFAKVDIPETLDKLQEWRARCAARPSCGG